MGVSGFACSFVSFGSYSHESEGANGSILRRYSAFPSEKTPFAAIRMKKSPRSGRFGITSRTPAPPLSRSQAFSLLALYTVTTASIVCGGVSSILYCAGRGLIAVVVNVILGIYAAGNFTAGHEIRLSMSLLAHLAARFIVADFRRKRIGHVIIHQSSSKRP